MKILAIEKVVANITEEQIKPHLKEEAKCVWELHKNEILREIYFTTTDNRAVLILECTDELSASSYLETLPLVKEKLIQFEILPLKCYSGFERLFEK